MKQAELFSGLLDGNHHKGGMRCLALFRVAAPVLESLREEVSRFQLRNPPSRVGDGAHVTHWTNPAGRVEQYSLLNRSGRSDDFDADHDSSCKGKWFFHAGDYPAVGRWMEDWPHLINFRVNVLGPGARLGAHEEHVPFRTRSGTIGARLRFHLPIETNENAEINLDGAVYHLAPGVVYLVNQGCVHAAQNRGQGPRVHLVWDALLTAELFAFLFGDTGAPAHLSTLSDRDPAPRRLEPTGPHRRLPPRLSAAESIALELCEPQ